jgi:hypothetical protein
VHPGRRIGWPRQGSRDHGRGGKLTGALLIALQTSDLRRLAARLPDDWDIPEPELPEWLGFVWRAWWRLHVDRPWLGGGMGPMLPGRIAWRDIREWAAFHKMSGDMFALLDRCICAMDDTYIEWQALQSDHSTTKNKGG